MFELIAGGIDRAAPSIVRPVSGRLTKVGDPVGNPLSVAGGASTQFFSTFAATSFPLVRNQWLHIIRAGLMAQSADGSAGFTRIQKLNINLFGFTGTLYTPLGQFPYARANFPLNAVVLSGDSYVVEDQWFKWDDYIEISAPTGINPSGFTIQGQVEVLNTDGVAHTINLFFRVLAEIVQEEKSEL